MRSYRPSVTCTTPLTRSPLVPDSHEFLSRYFPASKDRQVFGRVPPGQGIDVKLPWETKAPFRRPILKAVSILVRSNAARDTSSWFDLYVANQAVWSMCGSHGEAGIAENIGMIPSGVMQMISRRTNVRGYIGDRGFLTLELREVRAPGAAISSD